jgi:hypothetical protein
MFVVLFVAGVAGRGKEKRRLGIGSVNQQRSVDLPRFTTKWAGQVMQLFRPNSLDQVWPLIRVDDQP